MKSHNVRIAVTAVCMISCLLLVALRIRSFRTMDDVRLPWGNIESMRGRLIFAIGSSRSLGWFAIPVDRHDGTDWNEWDKRFYRYHVGWTNLGEVSVVVPHLFATVSIGFFSAALWVPWSKNFQLRTMFVVTTLVALICGLAIFCDSR